MLTAPVRVSFVCSGNICRSPTAEVVLIALAETAGRAGAVVGERGVPGRRALEVRLRDQTPAGHGEHRGPAGPPAEVAATAASRTAPYLARFLAAR